MANFLCNQAEMDEIPNQARRRLNLVDIYLTAKEAVIAKGFAWEIDWQAERRLDRVQESDFLRESAWTVLSAGFRETVVRRLFDPLSEAFLGWQSATLINDGRFGCKQAALRIFNSERKVNAILDIAATVAECGFETVRNRIREGGVTFLRTLPYIGPITSFHLAKNLGLPVVKPDRHMQRIAKAAGFGSPRELCDQIADHVGEPISVIDVVLWRYATLFPKYPTLFSAVSKHCS